MYLKRTLVHKTNTFLDELYISREICVYGKVSNPVSKIIYHNFVQESINHLSVSDDNLLHIFAPFQSNRSLQMSN